MRRIATAVVSLAAACSDHPLERPIVAPVILEDECVALSFERDVDLLFVVDNSNSMREEQVLISQQFANLVFALERLDGGFPNAHIGVVSSDLGAGSYAIDTCLTPGGDRGCLQFMERGTCTGPSPEPFISVTNQDGRLEGNIPDVATPMRDDSGAIVGCNGDVGDGALDACDVAEAFSCIAELGVNGCGFEQHLEVVARALSEPNTAEGGCNGGFLRSGALLAVVVLADEDDCSAQNPMLFNPADQDIDDPLGPLQSFRCAEFGYTCDQEIMRAGGLTLTGCGPIEDCGDDCWLYPTARYASFLEEMRPSGKLLFAVIGGPWDQQDAVRTGLDKRSNPEIASSCAGDSEAAPGIRLRAVADALGDDGLYAADSNAAVCSEDYSPALDALFDRIRQDVRPGCIDTPLVDAGGDLIASPNEAQGTLEEVFFLGDDDKEERTLLPRCEFADPPADACPPLDVSPGAAANAPCWFLCDSSGLDAPCNGPGAKCTSPACRWQFRLCRNGACDPLAPPPDDTTACANFVTCDPMVSGCLCGDGVCDGGLQENAASCEADCGG